MADLEALQRIPTLRCVKMKLAEIIKRSWAEKFLLHPDRDSVRSFYSNWPTKLARITGKEDLEVVLDLGDMRPMPRALQFWLVASANPLWTDCILLDQSLGPATHTVLLQQFLAYSGHHCADLFAGVFDSLILPLIERGADLSRRIFVPSLGFEQTSFELIFRCCASRSVIRTLFFSKPKQLGGDFTYWQDVLRKAPSYPFFWAQSLYFTSATGFASSDELVRSNSVRFAERLLSFCPTSCQYFSI